MGTIYFSKNRNWKSFQQTLVLDESMELYLLGASEYTIFIKTYVYCSACYFMLCLGPGVPDIGGSIRLTLPTKAKHMYLWWSTASAV